MIENVRGQVVMGVMLLGAGAALGYLVRGDDRGRSGEQPPRGELEAVPAAERDKGGRQAFGRRERERLQAAVLGGEADVLHLLEQRLRAGSEPATDLLGDIQALAEVAGAEGLKGMFLKVKQSMAGEGAAASIDYYSLRQMGLLGAVDYLGPIVENWARVDPAGAAGFLANYDDTLSTRALGRVHAVWSRTDPDAAMSSAASSPGLKLRHSLVGQVLIALGEDEPREALEMVGKQKMSKLDTSWIAGELFAKWGTTRPEEAAAEIGTSVARTARMRAVEGLAMGWAKKDPQAALAWAESLDGAMRQQAILRIIPALANQDPDRALEVGLGLAPNRETMALWEDLGKSYYREDPEEALARASAMDPGPVRNELFVGVLQQMMESDPVGAANLAQSYLPYTTKFSSIVAHSALALAREDQVSALEWAEGIENAMGKDVAVREIVSVWARTAPRKALEYVAEANGGVARGVLASIVFDTWAMEDPESAMRAAEGLGAESRVTTMGRVMGRWGGALTEVEGATSYVETVEDPEVRAALTEKLVKAWSSHDVPAAAEWLLVAGGVEEHPPLAKMLVERWIRDDLQKASAWVALLPRGVHKDLAVDVLLGKLGDDPEAMALWVQEIEDTELKGRWLRAIPGGGE